MKAAENWHIIMPAESRLFRNTTFHKVLIESGFISLHTQCKPSSIRSTISHNRYTWSHFLFWSALKCWIDFSLHDHVLTLRNFTGDMLTSETHSPLSQRLSYHKNEILMAMYETVRNPPKSFPANHDCRTLQSLSFSISKTQLAEVSHAWSLLIFRLHLF